MRPDDETKLKLEIEERHAKFADLQNNYLNTSLNSTPTSRYISYLGRYYSKPSLGIPHTEIFSDCVLSHNYSNSVLIS